MNFWSTYHVYFSVCVCVCVCLNVSQDFVVLRASKVTIVSRCHANQSDSLKLPSGKQHSLYLLVLRGQPGNLVVHWEIEESDTWSTLFIYTGYISSRRSSSSNFSSSLWLRRHRFDISVRNRIFFRIVYQLEDLGMQERESEYFHKAHAHS